MTREGFEKIVEDEFPNAIPENFRHRISNVAFLVEDEPDEATRREHELAPDETLLGLYRGVPHTARGDMYGIGEILPDTITLYLLPLEDEAEALMHEFGLSYESAMRRAVRETIWHEVAHHFGMDEDAVGERELKRRLAEDGTE